MADVKAVIGANFGDEGKGLMTDYFCAQAVANNKSCIVVLSNGGAQRGHTVVDPLTNERHVYHHCGSGDIVNADTFIPWRFVVNPLLFDFDVKGKIFVDDNCLITTPWDMMANQIIEESRGDQKHGSCGVGLWETIRRNQIFDTNYCWYFKDRLEMADVERILGYYDRRFKSNGIKVNELWRHLFFDSAETMLERFLKDLESMSALVETSNDEVLNRYDTVVFENGQGLLLDQNNARYAPHITASNTGIKNVLDIMKREIKTVDSFEACYVTRSYITRHGAGMLPNECKKEEISKYIRPDETNVFNIHQGELRYATLDVDDMLSRINDDYGVNSNTSIAFTHMDEVEINTPSGYKTYVSRGKTRNDIERIR